jgi:hypothetical protein
LLDFGDERVAACTYIRCVVSNSFGSGELLLVNVCCNISVPLLRILMKLKKLMGYLIWLVLYDLLTCALSL